MSSEVKANKVSPATGTDFTFGDSGDTFTVPSGATIVNSGTATGFGGGKVVQMVQMSDSSNESTTSASYQDSDYTLAITPASSSNIIVAICNVSCRAHRASATDVGGQLRLYNSTDTVTLAESRYVISGSSTNWDLQFGQCLIGYDTGRSVATTYLLQYYAFWSGTMIVGYLDQPNSLILMEIEP